MLVTDESESFSSLGFKRAELLQIVTAVHIRMLQIPATNLQLIVHGHWLLNSLAAGSGPRLAQWATDNGYSSTITDKEEYLGNCIHCYCEVATEKKV